MNNSLNDLKNEFNRIKKLGWIESLRKGSSGIGFTFEHLIGREENSLAFPDYEGIEIKTKRRFCVGYVTLFSAEPDGDYLFSSNYLLDNYGYSDKDYPEYKVFNRSISNYDKNKFKLFIDYFNRKVVLYIYKDNILYNTSVSWSFDMLENKLYTKLSYLALVRADVRKCNGKESFYYYNICFYKIRNFKVFLDLLYSGKIRVSFKMGIFKDEKNFGKRNNHGTSFDIHLEDLEELFIKLNM